MAASDKATESRISVPVLERGLRVLRCFTPRHPERSVSDLAEITGIPQPTVWKLCHTLEQVGYLRRVPGRQTLRPGIALLGLGFAVLADLPIAELARPDMEALASRHEGAVSLGARVGLDILYIQRCQGDAIVRADLRVGSRVPMVTSATGWAYLASLVPDDRDQLMGELQASAGEGWADVAPPLCRALEAFETDGYIMNIGMLHSRINSVAVPISAGGSSELLTMSCGGISDIFTPERMAVIGKELLALAADLELALSRPRAGGPVEPP